MQPSFIRVVFTALVGVAVQFAPAYAQGVWATESSEGFSPRSNLASVVVDGKIYAIGGANEGTYLGTSTLEVFDPSTGTWSSPATTGTFTPRMGMAAAIVGSRIYVMGGWVNGVSSNILEVFDTRTNEWTTPATTGTFTPRKDLAAVLHQGKIYAIGGNNRTESLTTVEVFDPVANEWTTPSTTGTFTPRYGFASALVDGKIYAFGGWVYRPGEGINTRVNALEVFDPATNQWSTPVTTGVSTARSGVSAAVVSGKIYTFGGRDGSFLEVFDPVTNVWTTPVTAGNATYRSYVQASLVGNKIYVLGGRDPGGVFLNTNESLTLETSTVDELVSTRPSVTMFPNPTGGGVLVRGASEHSRVSVSNALGERIIDTALLRAGDFTIDLSTFVAGRYYVSVVTDGGVTTEMIVRE